MLVYMPIIEHHMIRSTFLILFLEVFSSALTDGVPVINIVEFPIFSTQAGMPPTIPRGRAGPSTHSPQGSSSWLDPKTAWLDAVASNNNPWIHHVLEVTYIFCLRPTQYSPQISKVFRSVIQTHLCRLPIGFDLQTILLADHLWTWDSTACLDTRERHPCKMATSHFRGPLNTNKFQYLEKLALEINCLVQACAYCICNAKFDAFCCVLIIWKYSYQDITLDLALFSSIFLKFNFGIKGLPTHGPK